MPSLSLIEEEARRLVGGLPESRRLARQDALVSLCEKHWQQLRGAQPDEPLAQDLWEITPSLADLLLDLYASGDAELDDILHGGRLGLGMALLVLAEIERGHEHGVHAAYEPMMAYETLSPSAEMRERVSALLRGTLDPPVFHPHDKHHDAMWKALAIIAEQTRRLDLPAVLMVLRLLIDAPDPSSGVVDAGLGKLQYELDELGVRFVMIEDDHVHFTLHGHSHKPVRIRHLGELLLEIRQAWLG